MLRAIDEPLSLLILLVAFVLALTLNGWVTSLLAARQGAHAVRHEGRMAPDPRRHLDPFGGIGVILGGVGWSKPVEIPRRSAGQVAGVVLVGPVLLLGIGVGLLAGYGAVGDFGLGGASVLLREGIPSEALDGVEMLLLLGGLTFLYTGALMLIPLPPLPGGQVLFAAAPRTLGWQKAEYQLVERNIGTAVVLLLILLPIGGPDPIIQAVLDGVLGPLIELATGA